MSSRQYKNPPIEEALCEFIFTPTEEWNLTLPGKLQMAIKDEYSGSPRQVNIQKFVPRAPNTMGLENDFRVQFPTSDATRFVTIGKDSVVINVLKPYEGWTLFKPRIMRALEAYERIANLQSVVRIGVRYINKIIIPSIGTDPALYFNLTSTKEKGLNAKLASFTWRSEYLADDQTKLMITHAGIAPSGPDRTEFILDIDTVFDQGRLEGLDRIMEAVEKLHTTEGCAFESIITDEARKLFDAS